MYMSKAACFVHVIILLLFCNFALIPEKIVKNKSYIHNSKTQVLLDYRQY